MTQPSSSMQTSNPAMNQDPMDWLFGEIYGLFGNQFLDKFRSGHTVDGLDTGIENMKSIWAVKIRENGLKLSDIKRGIKGCERCKFGAPGWPEFLELCRPTPNVDEALSEALVQLQKRQTGDDVWSHPAIYWATMKVGYYDMTNLSSSALKPRFASALTAALAGEIQPVPPMRVAIAAPVQQTEIDLADAKARLAELKSKNIFSMEPRGDQLRWAKSILEREKKGDKSVSLLQLNEAKQAMRLA